MKYFRSILFLLVIACIGCNKDEPVNQKPQADFNYTDNIDHFVLKDNSIDEDGDVLSYKWVSLSNQITIDGNTSIAKFELPASPISDKVQIRLIVSDDLSSDSITKEISLPESSVQRNYGLGINLTGEKSNNAAWPWYLDQMNTGQYSGVNCGPTSVTMAIKWFNQNFNKTPEDARNTYRSGGGWWYTDDIISYLNLYSVYNKTISLVDFSAVKSQIDLGNILILCLDMYYIRQEGYSKWHVDKFYSANTTGWGHFIVVKGYKQVDNEIFYEVYDPYCFGNQYIDGKMKGEDRYYRKTDLQYAVSIWWNYAIVVSKSSLKNLKGVNLNQIVHKPGR
jgi:hypothetical protein